MSKTKKSILIYLVIVIAILAVGLLGMKLLADSKTPVKKRKTEIAAPPVRTIIAKVGKYTVDIMGEGTVRPLKEISLVPQVDGKVVYTSPALVNGGIFKKGTVLLKIEQADYEIAVTLAEAKVKSAESLLQQAEQESEAAREEWRIYHASGPKAGTPPPLVAKEPQLAAARAKLAANMADLKKALLNMKRTELKAPFHGRVSQEKVDIGQYVSHGQSLATLFSTNAAEITIPLDKNDLFWFNVPGITSRNRHGSPATIFADIAGKKLLWPGKIVRTQGKLDERTRMINVIVLVEKPYDKNPPLVVGLFVDVKIEGKTLSQACRIPRSALHRGNIVWVVNKNRSLHFRKVDVARFQDSSVIILSGLNDGDMLVVSPLKAVTDGMTVRTIPVKEANK